MADSIRPRDIATDLGLREWQLYEASEHEKWGAFYRFDDRQTVPFVQEYFPEIATETWTGTMLLRPSIVVVQPEGEIPAHFHDRRAELLRVIAGEMMLETVSRCGYKDMRAVGKGSVVTIEPGVQHTVRAGKEPLVLTEVWGRRAPGVETDYLDEIQV